MNMETETVVLGGGCFWCTEAVFIMLRGIVSVEPGYACSAGSQPAGQEKVPTYEQVSTGTTPYIETVEVAYDPDQLSFEEILHVFFASHDPTTPGRQGNDVGPHYASAIFYTTERQREKAQHYIDVVNGVSRPDQSVGARAKIVTQVAPLEMFYKAESYHKNYFANNASAGYCQLIIAPKVEKVENKFKYLLK